MVLRKWNWYSPAALLGLFAWDSLLPLSSLGNDDEPRIGILSDAFSRPVGFEATGLPLRGLPSLGRSVSKEDALSQIFAVFETNGGEELSSTPISGSYLIEGGRLTFIPLHPLRAGLQYRAVLQLESVLPSDESSSGLAVRCDVTITDRTANTDLRVA